jgi:hypothetical protein
MLKVLGTFISATRKKNKRIGVLAYTYRVCALSFIGHRGGVLNGMWCGNVVVLNGSSRFVPAPTLTAAVPIEHQRQGYQVVRDLRGAVGPPRHFGGNNLEQQLLPLILAEF